MSIGLLLSVGMDLFFILFGRMHWHAASFGGDLNPYQLYHMKIHSLVNLQTVQHVEAPLRNCLAVVNLWSHLLLLFC